MSKHTTRPRNPWHTDETVGSSHVFNFPDYPQGNWNRHKKRRVRSSMRTDGRYKRYLRRHHLVSHEYPPRR